MPISRLWCPGTNRYKALPVSLSAAMARSAERCHTQWHALDTQRNPASQVWRAQKAALITELHQFWRQTGAKKRKTPPRTTPQRQRAPRPAALLCLPCLEDLKAYITPVDTLGVNAACTALRRWWREMLWRHLQRQLGPNGWLHGTWKPWIRQIFRWRSAAPPEPLVERFILAWKSAVHERLLDRLQEIELAAPRAVQWTHNDHTHRVELPAGRYRPTALVAALQARSPACSEWIVSVSQRITLRVVDADGAAAAATLRGGGPLARLLGFPAPRDYVAVDGEIVAAASLATAGVCRPLRAAADSNDTGPDADNITGIVGYFDEAPSWVEDYSFLLHHMPWCALWRKMWQVCVVMPDLTERAILASTAEVPWRWPVTDPRLDPRGGSPALALRRRPIHRKMAARSRWDAIMLGVMPVFTSSATDWSHTLAESALDQPHQPAPRRVLRAMRRRVSHMPPPAPLEPVERRRALRRLLRQLRAAQGPGRRMRLHSEATDTPCATLVWERTRHRTVRLWLYTVNDCRHESLVAVVEMAGLATNATLLTAPGRHPGEDEALERFVRWGRDWRDDDEDDDEDCPTRPRSSIFKRGRRWYTASDTESL